jgi:hypothetical protein
MKICRYNDSSTGLIEADRVYPLDQVLASMGAVKVGASVQDQIAALSNPSLGCARSGFEGPLSSVGRRQTLGTG